MIVLSFAGLPNRLALLRDTGGGLPEGLKSVICAGKTSLEVSLRETGRCPEDSLYLFASSGSREHADCFLSLWPRHVRLMGKSRGGRLWGRNLWDAAHQKYPGARHQCAQEEPGAAQDKRRQKVRQRPGAEQREDARSRRAVKGLSCGVLWGGSLYWEFGALLLLLGWWGTMRLTCRRLEP